MNSKALILWDIDRTLLYVGELDQLLYSEIFEELVGRPAVILPERGTGVTTPIVVHRLFADNGVPQREVPVLIRQALLMLPERLAERRDDLTKEGMIMPGARETLEAVGEQRGLIQSVVSGNLKTNALIKLAAFRLDKYLDVNIGGFASDDDFRPNLVPIVQRRAEERYGTRFTRANSVIIGDSCEDVRTGRMGGSSVIGVASGTTTRRQLEDTGADMVFDDLTDTESLLAAIVMLTSTQRSRYRSIR